MRELHLAYVKQPDDNDVSLEVELNPKHQAFSGCIGAIDGTHIAAFIPAAYRNLFWNRKGEITQNEFAAVRLDGTFSVVLAGGEGRLHDARLCRIAIANDFKIPKGRF